MNPESLPRENYPLYRAEAMRTLDRHAIENAGIPGYTLMTRAATAAWTALQARWPDARELLVLCGGGNNGGDRTIGSRASARVRIRSHS